VHIGPLARTVADAALMTKIMAGPHNRDPFCLPDDGVDYVGAVAGRTRKLRVAYSPRLGNFPVDAEVATVVARAIDVMRRHGIEVDEVELDFKADHKDLAALWVRTMSIHYAAIAVYWKQEGIDLMGEHAKVLTPQFLAMLEGAYKVSAVDHALDDLLRTGVHDGLED
ncbi:MAG: amidase, partial [Mesorhizobium sp.]